jgi:hypothetical protein
MHHDRAAHYFEPTPHPFNPSPTSCIIPSPDRCPVCRTSAIWSRPFWTTCMRRSWCCQRACCRWAGGWREMEQDTGSKHCLKTPSPLCCAAIVSPPQLMQSAQLMQFAHAIAAAPSIVSTSSCNLLSSCNSPPPPRPLSYPFQLMALLEKEGPEFADKMLVTIVGERRGAATLVVTLRSCLSSVS